MEKRISFIEFQSVKSVAKAIDPIQAQKRKIQSQIDNLEEEFKEKAQAAVLKLKSTMEEKKELLEQELNSKNVQIDALQAGILQIIGLPVEELVKKVIEPTNSIDKKTGKPIKVTKYLPTNIVTYDNDSKQYVVHISEDNDGTVVPPTTENMAGSDFDKDNDAPEFAESPAPEEEEVNAEENQMPWSE